MNFANKRTFTVLLLFNWFKRLFSLICYNRLIGLYRFLLLYIKLCIIFLSIILRFSFLLEISLFLTKLILALLIINLGFSVLII